MKTRENIYQKQWRNEKKGEEKKTVPKRSNNNKYEYYSTLYMPFRVSF